MKNDCDLNDSKQSDKVRWEKFQGKSSISEETHDFDEQAPKVKKGRNILLLPLLVAGIMIMTLVVLTSLPSPSMALDDRQKAKKPIPKTESINEKKSIEVSNNPTGKSLALIEQSIKVEKRSPNPSEISIPEILNSFPLEVNSKVIAYSDCQIGVEILPSPWRPSCSLIIVKMTGGKLGHRRISAQYKPDDETAVARRILGHVSGKQTSQVSISACLGSNKNYLFALEVESVKANLGKLLWSTDGKGAPDIELVVDSDKEPSIDGQFASLLAAFGLWLRGENSAVVDEALVLGLARELAARDLPQDKYDFLGLVDLAVKYAHLRN